MITADMIIQLESSAILYHQHLTHVCGRTEHIHVLLHSAVLHKKLKQLIENQCGQSLQTTTTQLRSYLQAGLTFDLVRLCFTFQHLADAKLIVALRLLCWHAGLLLSFQK